MSLILSILVGLLVGVVARLLHPGKEDLGMILTIVLGVAGSMLASFGGQFLGIYRAGEGAGFIGAVIGAVILLMIYSRLRARP